MKECELNGIKLRVYENGEIEYYYLRHKIWKKASEKLNDEGYKNIMLNGKTYKQHRIVGFAFLGLDINNNSTNNSIDHINKIKHDNRVENLRIVSNQQNCQNTNAKGYRFHKNGWEATITINGKRTFKRFKTEADAIQWRDEMKIKHYII